MKDDRYSCLDRAALLDPDQSLNSEWSLANRHGVSASASVLGTRTRANHGLLVTTTVDGHRRVLVAKLDEEIEIEEADGGERFQLATNEYHDGTLQPNGYLYLDRVCRDPGHVQWWYRARDVTIEKTISLLPRSPAAVIRYRLVDSRRPVNLRVMPFLTNRDVEGRTHGSLDWRFSVESWPNGLIARAWDGALPVGLAAWSARHGHVRSATFIETGLWYWRFLLRAERDQGFEPCEDLYTPGLFAFSLNVGDEATILLTADVNHAADPHRLEVRLAHDNAVDTLRRRANSALEPVVPPWLAAQATPNAAWMAPVASGR